MILRKLQIKLFPGTLIKRFKNNFSRKIFYLKQYEGTMKRIWGLELTIYGLKEAREVLRREYDKLNETLDAANIALSKKDLEAATKEALGKSITIKTQEIEEWKKKIDLSDETIKELESQVVGFREGLGLIEGLIRK